MPDSATANSEAGRRGGDPLAAMYVLAAVLLAAAGVAVVLAMFIPRGWLDRTDRAGVWVPSAAPTWTPSRLVSELHEPAGTIEIEPGRYVVNLVAHNWAFRPNEIRVPVGSEVTFRTRSEEDYHGIALVGTPLSVSFEQNEVKEATHTFDEPGEYLFVCSEYCGAGHVAMTGTVLVE